MFSLSKRESSRFRKQLTYNEPMSNSIRDTGPGEVVIDSKGPHRATVIWLHGLGADGNDFVPVLPWLGLKPEHGIRFIFPHAPVRPVTLSNGMRMRAWFDVDRLGAEGPRLWDVDGIADSISRLGALIANEERNGLSRDRILLAGFSQGGSLALEYLRRHGEGLSGVAAMSTFHPAQELEEAGGHAPELFMAHGYKDLVIPYALGLRTCDAYRAAGYHVQWCAYDMDHQVSQEELADLGAWIVQRLGN